MRVDSLPTGPASRSPPLLDTTLLIYPAPKPISLKSSIETSQNVFEAYIL